MNITDSQYKKWLNMSKVICSDINMAQDILQDLLLYILERNLEESKINDNYIFISLKNRFLSHISKESKTRDQFDTTLYIPDESSSIEDIEKEDKVNLSKLESIKDVITTLRSYEQTLWSVHHLHGLSQRHISRETGISHVALNKRINNIKKKIKDNYNGKKK